MPELTTPQAGGYQLRRDKPGVQASPVRKQSLHSTCYRLFTLSIAKLKLYTYNLLRSFPSSSLGMQSWKLQLPVQSREAGASRTGLPSWSSHLLHKCLRDNVIPAGIAGIQMPWMAMPKLATRLATRNCLMTSIHILVLWIPAIPAGMTCF